MSQPIETHQVLWQEVIPIEGKDRSWRLKRVRQSKTEWLVRIMGCRGSVIVTDTLGMWNPSKIVAKLYYNGDSPDCSDELNFLAIPVPGGYIYLWKTMQEIEFRTSLPLTATPKRRKD